MKKFFFLLFIPLIAILFLQCSEQFVEPNDQETASFLDKTKPNENGNGVGGGGGTELTNNLSFPAFLADGYSLDEVSEYLSVEYDGPYDYLTDVEKEYLAANGPWYAQKVEGNKWQARFYKILTEDEDIAVSYIDWGDNIESSYPRKDYPFRLEVTLYENISSSPMQGYEMHILSDPSSPIEAQGTNGVTYTSNLATIASNNAELIIQKWSSDTDAPTTWNAIDGKWDGAENPETNTFAFGVELNVAGKLIFGAAQAGWTPLLEGKYRITFYLPGSKVNLIGADIGPGPADFVAEPVVSETYNLSYVDVEVVE